MRQLLLSKEIPFFLTVLIGLMTYQMNGLVRLYTDSPILSHSFKTTHSKKKGTKLVRTIECELTNHDRKKTLKNVELVMMYESAVKGSKIVKSPDIVATAPSRILDNTYRSNFGEAINEYLIPRIHPDASYTLKAKVITDAGVTTCPKIYLQSGDDIRLLGPSFEVFIIRNQVAINVTFLITWFLFGCIYILIINKNRKHEKIKPT